MSFRRELGTFDATMVVVGGIIGAGIFINPYIVAQRLDSGWLVMAAWIAGGGIAIAGAFTFAELGSLFPTTGGHYASSPGWWRPVGWTGRRARTVWAALLVVGLGGCSVIQQAFEKASRRPTVRVLAYNIKHGEGMDQGVDLERAAAVIRAARPDVVTLQEIDRNTSRTERVDQAARLGDLTGLEHAFGPFMEYQGGEYGMAILSRWPIVEVVNHVLPPGEEPRSTLAARIRLPGEAGEVIVAGVHFYRTEQERFRQAREVVDIFEQEETPIILAGDFNSRRGDRVMDVIEHHWSLPDKGDPIETFPANRPEREIDFVGYRPADRFELLEYRVLDERVASDHRPVLMVLRLR